MLKFELEAREHGYKLIAGADEVGRGPLAGPVVGAAVILPGNLHLPEINDSKKLTTEKREELYEIIVEKAMAVAWSQVDNITIDRINILNAALEAMNNAVAMLDPAPDFILIDGNFILPNDLPQKAVVKGDALSQTIAAASIIAKVERDRIMDEFHEKFL